MNVIWSAAFCRMGVVLRRHRREFLQAWHTPLTVGNFVVIVAGACLTILILSHL